MQIDQQSLNFILAIVAGISIVLSVYRSIRNPQIKSESAANSLQIEMAALKKEVKDLKETDLHSLKLEIKGLSDSNVELSKTVVKLATIIDERIPKGTPNLTPPGR